MSKYLGETLVTDLSNTDFENYKPTDWISYYIDCYGGIDGTHHKSWLLDQIARISNDTVVIVKLAKWDDGQEEYRVNLDEPSQKYKDWVQAWEDDGCDYDEGIAP